MEDICFHRVYPVLDIAAGGTEIDTNQIMVSIDTIPRKSIIIQTFKSDLHWEGVDQMSSLKVQIFKYYLHRGTIVPKVHDIP